MPLPPSLVAAPTEATPAEAVAPLIRGTVVLRALDDAGGALSLPELERATGLARSTLDRIAGTLARMGYLRMDGRTVLLAPSLMELGNAYLEALRLPDLLAPYAHELAGELDESVSLAVADGDGVRFIHQTTRRRALSVSFRVGDLLPVERCGPGPLLAAGWNEADWARWRRRRAADPDGLGFPALPPGDATRVPTDAEFTVWARQAGEQGWALDDQLIEPGLVALSVPVHAPDGTVACATSLVSHTSRHSAEDLRERLLPTVRATVAVMERRLREAEQPEPEPHGAHRASWISASKQELGQDFVGSLARGLTVLTAFGTGREELTLTAVAQATGQAKATARRALITLAHLGYVTADAGTFRLKPRVLALGYAPLSRLRLPQIAQPHLEALTERVHDSTSLAVLDGDEVRYTARVATRRIMSVDVTVGTRFPAHATSIGRVLLGALPTADRARLLERARMTFLTPYTVTDREELAAVLDQVVASGYSLVDQELEEGLRSIAVPVRDRTGRVVAAVNVATHTGRRSTQEIMTEVLPELRATGDAITADLRVAGRFTRVPEV
ncbi:IclR family transcriptional regulator domain-containing protein [Streptomyces sp. ME19-01-6]|uniref:IclR family transcriptional regulator domain-containing protein n=1 Tax=Streptomyces sp. ME19-01-6 TaxID=3028686 RepID=UPI0029BCFC7D|nr:IclR family transcriptional regulator C-terminal domain-containing protein [Streptomyces sp. ME19-01-6]MDX3231884.1 IclR family transcriptional regulator C-terminal domain-containing protein [Streptomyces sp. ME19-01-6]